MRRLLGTPWAAGNRMPGDPEPGGGDDLMSIQTAWGRQAELPVQRLQVTFTHAPVYLTALPCVLEKAASA